MYLVYARFNLRLIMKCVAAYNMAAVSRSTINRMSIFLFRYAPKLPEKLRNKETSSYSPTTIRI